MMQNPFFVFACVIASGMIAGGFAVFGAAIASMVGWLDWPDWPLVIIGFPALFVLGLWAVKG